MRKPVICICENKGADQLCSNCTADQRLCFRYIDTTIPLLPKSEISSLKIYPAELQLNKANASDTEAAFLDLNLSIHNDIISTKIYDKRDDYNFDILNFPFLDGDVPQRPSYGVYISQLIRFARASSHVTDFYNRNKLLTANLLKQGYRYHKLRKAFSKFYRRHFELIEKYHVSLKKGICNLEFYGDLVYKFKKIIGNPNFSNGCAALFSCTTVVQASDSMTASM